jgi:DNA-binding CsgD family transcriptional regulator
VLVGRYRERAVLDDVVEAVRRGAGRALVLSGEAGVGKSALLEHLVERATGCRVVRAAGVQSEAALPYAGLHQLCAPLLDRLDDLPEPQRAGLGAAFGMAPGSAVDRFRVALAVLGLLATVAEDGPLLCVVDDVQWWDRSSIQALAFVARRLKDAPIGVVLAVRDCDMVEELAGLPGLPVAGLATADARTLLQSVIRSPLDPRVQDRIVLEAGGNPLALLDLGRAVPAIESAGGYGPVMAPPVPRTIQDGYAQRLMTLSPDVRRLALVVAADPTGDPALVWRAAERLGLRLDRADLAAAADLVDVEGTARFRHPLARSAVYRAAAPEERREVHRALGEATDPERDADRRAWHLAHATDLPDAEVALELERSATRARARGGLAAAAAFLERAAALTPDADARAARLLAAAEAKHLAGGADAALDLLAAAEEGPLDDLRRAELERLRGQIALAATREGDAPSLLLGAARRFNRLDAKPLPLAYLEAFTAAMFAARDEDVVEVAEAVRSARGLADGDGAEHRLVEGMAVLVIEGHEQGTPALADALATLCPETGSPEDRLCWLWLACHAAGLVWDFETWDRLSNEFVGLAREAGAMTVLPLALANRARWMIDAGELAAAGALLDEMEAISELVPRRSPPYVAVALAAVRGDDAEARDVAQAAAAAALERGEHMWLPFVQSAVALLHNGLGRYADAAIAAEKAGAQPLSLWFPTWASMELVEACARLGDRRRAAPALERIVTATSASGSDWGLGAQRLARALMADGDEADRLYSEAIERLDGTGVRLRRARARLLYGEWLRRERRRREAREQLRQAREAFAAMGAKGFAERAARELQASGETARKRTAETSDLLTPREAQVAGLARDGLTNTEIGSRLFLSPRTVEYHLAKVFTKLSIASRNELDVALSAIGDGDDDRAATVQRWRG